MEMVDIAQIRQALGLDREEFAQQTEINRVELEILESPGNLIAKLRILGRLQDLSNITYESVDEGCEMANWQKHSRSAHTRNAHHNNPGRRGGY